MAGIQFQHVSNKFRQHLQGTKKSGERQFLEALFPEFLREEEVNGIVLDPKWISDFFTGKREHWKGLGETYSTPENQELMKQHVRELIENCRVSSEYLRKDLTLLVEEDYLLTDAEKKSLLDISDPVDFIAEVLLRSILQTNRGKIQQELQDAIRNQYFRAPCDEFVGREAELEQLHSLLAEKHHVFLTGVAGIGKSELVKAYLHRYGKCYTPIIRISSCGDLRQDLAAFSLTIREDGKPVRRKLINVRNLPREALLVLDNYNEAYADSGLDELMQDCPCTILVTTRCRYTDVASMNLEEMSREDQIRMMQKHLDGFPVQESVLEKISALMNGHTLTMCLAARILRKGIRKAYELCFLLEKDAVLKTVRDHVGLRKDGRLYNENYYSHLRLLFRLMNLSQRQQDILSAMTLMPADGIPLQEFRMGMDLAATDEIQDLIELGLIRMEKDGEINLYPLICDFSAQEIRPTVRQVEPLLVRMQARGLACGLDDRSIAQFGEIADRIMRITEKDDPKLYLQFLENTMGHAQQHHRLELLEREVQELAGLLEDPAFGSQRDRDILNSYRMVFEDSDRNWETCMEVLSRENSWTQEEIYSRCDARNSLAMQYMNRQEWDSAEEQIGICLKLTEAEREIRSRQLGTQAPFLHMRLDFLCNMVGLILQHACVLHDEAILDRAEEYIKELEKYLREGDVKSEQDEIQVFALLLIYYQNKNYEVRLNLMMMKLVSDSDYFSPQGKRMVQSIFNSLL